MRIETSDARPLRVRAAALAVPALILGLAAAFGITVQTTTLISAIVLNLPTARAEEDLQKLADDMEMSVDQSSVEASDEPSVVTNPSAERKTATEDKTAQPSTEPSKAEGAPLEEAGNNETVRPGVAVCGRMENRRRRVESTCQQAKSQTGKLRDDLGKRCSRQRDEFNASYTSCPGFERF